MLRISQGEERILRALARFQYLTSSQFVRLGAAKSKASIYPMLRRLCDTQKPSIAHIHYNGSPTTGRLESVYFLTAQGVKVLEGLGLENRSIKRPLRRDVSFSSDYHHRVWTVDFFIEALRFCEAQSYELGEFYYYFQQRSGSNRNNKGGRSLSDTRLDIEMKGYGSIIPDGVLLIRREPERPIFGLFEQHNGKDTGKLLRQLEGHRLAISEGLPSMKYNVRHEGKFVGNRVFVSFQREGCMQATMHRLAKDPSFQPFLGHFAFTLSSTLKEQGFASAWEDAHGRTLSF